MRVCINYLQEQNKPDALHRRYSRPVIDEHCTVYAPLQRLFSYLNLKRSHVSDKSE